MPLCDVRPPPGVGAAPLGALPTCDVDHLSRPRRALSHGPICTLQMGTRPVALRIVFALQGDFVRRLHRVVVPLGLRNRAW